MHWGVNRFQWRAAFHVTNVKSFVSVLHFVNKKNAVEYIVAGIATVNSLPYRGSLIYLERKRVTNVEGVTVGAQSYSISQMIPQTNILREEANPPRARCTQPTSLSQRVSNTCRGSTDLALHFPQMDFHTRYLNSFSQAREIGRVIALIVDEEIEASETRASVAWELGPSEYKSNSSL